MAKTMGDALKETHLNSKQAKTTAIISLFLSLAALVAAGVSAYFAYEDSKTDSLWQKDQIAILNKGINKNATQNKELKLVLNELVQVTKNQTELHRKALELIEVSQKETLEIKKANKGLNSQAMPAE